jgi:hypothetical protein
MRYCFDLDDTLCTGSRIVDGVTDYSACEPLLQAAMNLRALSEQGHTIIICTARGMGSTGGDQAQAALSVGEMTKAQLHAWGFVYDEIYFGKPSADIYIDDKGLNSAEWWINTIFGVQPWQ